MRLLANLLLSCLALEARRPAFQYAFHVVGDEPTSWPAILGSIGMTPAADGSSSLIVLPGGTAAAPATWLPRIEAGALVIIEGESPLAEALGIRPTTKRVPTQSVIDRADPKLPIVWEKSIDLPQYEVPPDATIRVEKSRPSGCTPTVLIAFNMPGSACVASGSTCAAL